MAVRSDGRVEHMVSAGGIVHRVERGQMQVLLCGRREPPVWRLPKGTPDMGETLQETALREVREETGLDVEIQAPLGTITYWFWSRGVRCRKTVYHHLMVPVGGSTDRHDPEFDIVQWFDAEDACQLLTYENEVKMVRLAMNHVLGNGAAPTSG